MANSTNGGTPPLLRIAALAALAPLIWYGNPAVALLSGAALAIGFDRSVVPRASVLGRYALQSAIVLLGFRLSAAELWRISADYSLFVTGYVVLTLAAGLALGRLLRNASASSQLIASGTAICGGTAIASLSPVIGARPAETGVALALVFLLNAVALFTFPAIGSWLELTQTQFGVWAALAIHDTSSVVATSAIYGEEATAVATTVKLGRTLWLIPLLLVASLGANRSSAKIRVPLFIVLFIAAAAASTFFALPADFLTGAAMLSKALLVVALFLVGTEIRRATVAALRGAALVQGVALWLLVVPATLALAVCAV